MHKKTMARKPVGLLEGICVVDLADETGSFCSRLLADLGADVTRIEILEERSSGCSVKILPKIKKNRKYNINFIYSNTSKKINYIDIQFGEGKRKFEELLKKADVLVETSSTGCLGNLNLVPPALIRLNPRLIHLSITAFGRSGPKRDYAASSTIASAAGGQMFVCRDRRGVPTPLYGTQPYYTASLCGAVAVLLNILRRTRTGLGNYIDLSVQESVASMLDHVPVDFFSDGTVTAGHSGSQVDSEFPILPCRDGFLQLTILQNWETLLEILVSENSAEDLAETRWRDPEFREEHFPHIVEVFKKWTGIHSKKELFELGQTLRFPWATVAEPAEVLRSPQLRSREFFTATARPPGGPALEIPGSPYRFRSVEAPLNGETATEQDGLLQSEQNTAAAPCNTGDILKRIRVLDLSRMLSGPYCTRILADFGAEVIKIQSGKTARGAEENDTAYFNAWNRNKRSVTLDLDTQEARKLFLKLVSVSHIVVENYAPRVMANWNLQYDRLCLSNPSLIMLSLSAMGQTGPWKEYVGFGPTFHALSGLVFASTTAPFHPFITIGHAYGDTVAGLYGALAILSALHRKDRTCCGQHIDLSAYESLCTFLGPALMNLEASGSAAAGMREQTNGTGAAPDGCYPCAGKDRWCAVTIKNDGQWRLFCDVLEDPELRSDRFSTADGRKRHLAALNARICNWTSSNTAEFVGKILQKAGIAAHTVQNVDDLARDPQLGSRNFFRSLQHPSLGTSVVDRSSLWPYLSDTECWRAAPALGASNYDIFVNLLGLSEAEFRDYVCRGIIG